LDAFIFLRFLRFCIRISVVTAAIGMVFLWPLYFTSNGHQDGVVGVGLYTMANVEPNGHRLYGSVIFCWIFTLYFLYEIEEEYKTFVILRHEFLLTEDPRLPFQEKLSVLVENLPLSLQSPEALKNLFETIFPGQVATTRIACLTTELEEQIQLREEILTELEIAIAFEQSSPEKKRKMIKIDSKKNEPTLLSLYGDEVDAIHFYSQKLNAINSVIKDLRLARPLQMENPLRPSLGSNGDVPMVSKDTANSSSYSDGGGAMEAPGDMVGTPTNTGFVTFHSRAAALSAYRLGTLFDAHPEIKVSAMGSKSEIIWSNLPYSTKEMEHGQNIESTLFRIGLLFWGTILAFIAAISNLNTLEKYLPFLKSLDDITYSILSGILPVAVMGYFISLLPVIFAYGGEKLSKLKFLSQIQEDVFHWMYGYQIANVFVTTLSGSVFDSLVEIIDNPTSIIGLLGASLPGASVFFGNFTLSAALIGGATELLQIGPLAIYLIYTKILKESALTRRQLLNGPLSDQVLNYGEYLPAVLFILFILQIYWIISPLTTLFAAIYFATKYVILKYQLLYVYTPKFEMGGIFWFGLFRYAMLGLLLSSITMLGYTALKEGQGQVAILFPLPFYVYWKWGAMSHEYESAAKDIPYVCAVRVDADRAEKNKRYDLLAAVAGGAGAGVSGEKESELLQGSDYYKQPALSAPIEAMPQPYRVDNKPLFDASGALNEEYRGPIVELDANAVASDAVSGQGTGTGKLNIV
jgi:calcium permeable stress-gated cation channel